MKRRNRRPGKRKKMEHRADGVLGRGMFVSREKQAQSLKAQRLHKWMRVVLWLVVIALVAAMLCFVAFYLFPFFHDELGGGTGSAASGESGAEESVPLVYDSRGLPMYDDTLNLFVINQDNVARREFSPSLVELGGAQVDKRISDALRSMLEQAETDGLAITFTEGYVSYEEQQKRHEQKLKELMESEGLTTVMAKTQAQKYEPQGGASDFQTGLCLKVQGDAATFEKSRTYSWLKANMQKYGFIFRFPEGKEQYTKMMGNPLVIRYVGSANADAMQQRSLCLEEYISYLASQ